jgi:hypothetical protein
LATVLDIKVVDLAEDVFPYNGDLDGGERGVGLQVEEAIFRGGFVNNIREVFRPRREIND